MATVHLGLATLSENQAAAEVTFNDSIYILDAIVQASAIDRIFDADSATATHGNVYLIHGGAPASGDAWENQENKITYYHTNTWNYISPKAGMMIYVTDEDKWYYYNGTAWKVGPLKTDSISGHLVLPVAQDFVLDLRAVSSYIITEVSGLTTQGTCDIQLKKNGTLVGTALAVDNSADNLQAESIAVAENDKIDLTVSNLSGTPQNLGFSVKINIG